MDLQLRNKVGIITGASRGIGAGIARTLAAEGCKLVLAARSTADLEAQAAEVRKLGGEAIVSTADLRQPAAVQPLVEATLKAFGRIDFVVTNAGTARMGAFTELTDADWDEGFDLKFFGHVRLLRACWLQLKANKGKVVIIAGAAGRTPAANAMITGSVNSALVNFTKSLADLGVTDGVRVNAVLPGAIRTARYEGRLKKAMARLNADAATAEQSMVTKQGITRIGEVEDIANVVAFLLGPQADYMQGSVVDVDGGRTKGV